jgi:hypothetical protein
VHRSARIAVLALAGLAAATACSPEHAGAAATVGDKRIDMGTVQTVAAQIDTGAYAQSTTLAVAQQTVLSRLVKRQIDVQLAPKLGVPIPSQSEVNATYQSVVQQAGGAASLTSGAASNGYAGSELLSELAAETLQNDLEARLAKAAPPTNGQLQALYAEFQSQLQGASFSDSESELVRVYAQQLLGVAEQKLASDIGVHVNSRFGSWSQAKGTVVADLTPLSSAGSGSAVTSTSPVLTTP